MRELEFGGQTKRLPTILGNHLLAVYGKALIGIHRNENWALKKVNVNFNACTTLQSIDKPVKVYIWLTVYLTSRLCKIAASCM